MYFLMVHRPEDRETVSTLYMIYDINYRKNDAQPKNIMAMHIPIFLAVNADGVKCELDIMRLLKETENTFSFVPTNNNQIYNVAFHSITVDEFPPAKRWMEIDLEDADNLEYTNKLEYIKQGIEILKDVVSEEEDSRVKIQEEEDQSER